MTNKTKQPTLPEVLKKVREALDKIQHELYHGLTHNALITVHKALTLLDSEQVTSEPEITHNMIYAFHDAASGREVIGQDEFLEIEAGLKAAWANCRVTKPLVQVTSEPVGEVYSYTDIDGDRQKSARFFHRVPDDTKLFTIAQPCARCADYDDRTRRHAENAEVLLEKIAALEAENNRLRSIENIASEFGVSGFVDIEALRAESARLKSMSVCEACIEVPSVGEYFTQVEATIAQQAEQLAAAEKDAERLNNLESLILASDVSIEEREPRHSEFRIHTGDTDYDKPFVGRTLREAIDAAIAASREGKS